MERLIKDDDRKHIEEMFRELDHPVTLVMFTQETECEMCSTTRQLLEELAGLSDRITLEVKDFVAEADEARRYGVDKIPAIVLLGERDHGIRFYGVPAGYEFATLLEGIVDASRRTHGLSEDVLALIEKVDEPVHMQVMITPT
jgi:glutaredoxin-like protein